MITSFNNRWTWLTFAVILGILIFHFVVRDSAGSGGTSLPEATATPRPVTNIVKIQIRPDNWTDWIKLPPGVAFRVNAPGWHRYQFWTGEQRVVEQNEVRWFGTVPASTFRLKGAEGEAMIYYDVP